MDYFAFYWTLPVPWAGFTQLPTDVDEAAKVSRTIRYQVERVRRWVADQNASLLGEEIFLELQPDRGTEQIVPVIEKLITRAEKLNAGIVLVDFSDAMHWRRHGFLWNRLNAWGKVMALDPVALTLAGDTLDPIEHFRERRQDEIVHASSRDDRRAAIIAVVLRRRNEGLSFSAIAIEFNATGVKTLTGKPWNGDNVRKYLAQV